MPEPRLPRATGWPFPERFPRTSGTGREAGGASYWSDFIYDDHGALAAPVGNVEHEDVTQLSPVRGSYAYNDPRARRNGADIFGAAVGLTRQATYWRVDWNTLVDSDVPIAEWTFDTDDEASTGASGWPAGAGVSSPGIERALVVSSRGARLLNAETGKLVGQLRTRVDRRARSFIVRVPRSMLPANRTWRIRLAAGLANDAGKGFAPPSVAEGAVSGGPAVYNVAFRTRRQEPGQLCPDGSRPQIDGDHSPTRFLCGNYWNENDQAHTLAAGDVSKYGIKLRWAGLAARRTTPEPRPSGYSVRWYVSRLGLGQGVVPNEEETDLEPNFLGRAQPYVVYVPPGHGSSRRMPLSWMLHSLDANHNQYAGVAPSQLYEQCDLRGSICVAPLGYGPDSFYFDEGEVDFWQVWRALADAYRLDPDGTVISGYSMGGYGTYKLGLAYPDLFAKALVLDEGSSCGVEGGAGLGLPVTIPISDAQRCARESNTAPFVGNARWLPFVMSLARAGHGFPIGGGTDQVDRFDRLGYRYHAFWFPFDHLSYGLLNDFSPAIAKLGRPHRVHNPGRINYAWYPNLTVRKLGIGPTGVYWIRGLKARESDIGQIASLEARSHGQPDRSITVRRKTSVLTEFHPTPGEARRLAWRRGPRPARSERLTLKLENVASVGVDAERARFRCGRLEVQSDGPTRVRLTRAAGARAVSVSGERLARVDRRGVAAFLIRGGETKARVRCG